MRDIEIKEQPITACVSCDRFFIAGRWSKRLKPFFDSIISDPVRILSMNPSDAFVGRAPKRVSFSLAIMIDGEEHVVDIDLPVNNMQCPECQKKHSHYFEGFLQLRGGSDEEYAIARSLLESHRGYIKEERKLKDGIDFKVSSNRAIIATLKELSSRFIGTSTTSTTLHTRDHQTSKEKHRVTGLFRFSKLRKGNVIIHDEIPLLIEKTKGSLCELRSIADPRTTMTMNLVDVESKERIEPFDSSVVAIRPKLIILSESYVDVEAVNLSSKKIKPGDAVRAVGSRGFYAVLE